MTSRLPKLTPAKKKSLKDRLQGDAPNIYGSDCADTMHADGAYVAMQTALERARDRQSNEPWYERWNRETGWTALTAEDAARMTKRVSGEERRPRKSRR